MPVTVRSLPPCAQSGSWAPTNDPGSADRTSVAAIGGRARSLGSLRRGQTWQRSHARFDYGLLSDRTVCGAEQARGTAVEHFDADHDCLHAHVSEEFLDLAIAVSVFERPSGKGSGTSRSCRGAPRRPLDESRGGRSSREAVVASPRPGVAVDDGSGCWNDPLPRPVLSVATELAPEGARQFDHPARVLEVLGVHPTRHLEVGAEFANSGRSARSRSSR